MQCATLDRLIDECQITQCFTPVQLILLNFDSTYAYCSLSPRFRGE